VYDDDPELDERLLLGVTDCEREFDDCALELDVTRVRPELTALPELRPFVPDVEELLTVFEPRPAFEPVDELRPEVALSLRNDVDRL
jgi:hypothetical protein